MRRGSRNTKWMCHCAYSFETAGIHNSQKLKSSQRVRCSLPEDSIDAAPLLHRSSHVLWSLESMRTTVRKQHRSRKRLKASLPTSNRYSQHSLNIGQYLDSTTSSPMTDEASIRESERLMLYKDYSMHICLRRATYLTPRHFSFVTNSSHATFHL